MLLIGPGNSNIRESIYNHVRGNNIFNKTSAKLTLKWASIYKIKLSAVSRLEGKSKDDIKEKLATQLDKFFNHDYKLLEKSLMELNPEKK